MKNYLKQYFVTKDTGKPSYFLGIGVAYQNNILLSIRKHVLDLLQKTGLLGCKPVSILMEVDMDFQSDDIKVYDNVK